MWPVCILSLVYSATACHFLERYKHLVISAISIQVTAFDVSKGKETAFSSIRFYKVNKYLQLSVIFNVYTTSLLSSRFSIDRNKSGENNCLKLL